MVKLQYLFQKQGFGAVRDNLTQLVKKLSNVISQLE